MNSIPTGHVLIAAAIMFIVGAVGVMARRNLLWVLMSIEIMLNAAAVAFIAAASKWRLPNGGAQPDGQVVVIFILVIAATEVAVALSLLLRIYDRWKTLDTDQVSEMKG